MKLINGNSLPRIGQGTWFMGEKPFSEKDEISSLRTGLDNGLSLIDTAEMYGEGGAERIVGKAIKERDREDIFIVSKAYPHHATVDGLQRSCEASLKRMGTDVIDLYLLHWRGSVPLEETAEGMKKLQRAGKIRYWGVSNLDVDDLEELIDAGGGDFSTDQVLYNLGSRGVDYDLKPYLMKRKVPMMAYCPIAQAGRLNRRLFTDKAVLHIAKERNWSAAQTVLSFCLQDGVIPIPKASKPAHALENAAMLNERLTEEERALLDRSFPSPKVKQYLDMV